ncbi:hypothetical protein ACVIHI_004927 [Bradyrhizobium sp. USDA 4524]|uniref:hypothetical protein n=1 Tax=unclassified Bradyrhizobium TaxID=2631580 RepID=UPI00209E6135|nr:MULTISPECIES: hypothetical protein [unclassified Bradyrhizobium]MCP1842155.1 hypothetical protein [Bradyrhizobium sp. USDA 4538]MCP1902719.1 hypothetical protein [Bradyrhizobium sp. USDA 4537]MCP1991624.1 hypothetical protein [Bradyrhizobium sp. USDA 4539]
MKNKLGPSGNGLGGIPTHLTTPKLPKIEGGLSFKDRIGRREESTDAGYGSGENLNIPATSVFGLRTSGYLPVKYHPELLSLNHEELPHPRVHYVG